MHVLVFNPDGIVLVRRILYYLSGLVVLEPSRTGLYLEGKMLDLRIGIELWSALDQWDAPLRRAQRRQECAPRGQTVGPGLLTGNDVFTEC